MPRRRAFSINDLPMVGGALALDFVNTTGARASGRGTPPDERKEDFERVQREIKQNRTNLDLILELIANEIR
jgi:hypothetical protein